MEIVFQSLHGCPFILGSVSHFFSVWHPDSYLLWLSVDFLALQMAAFPHPPQLTQQQGVESPSPPHTPGFHSFPHAWPLRADVLISHPSQY